MSDVAVRPVKGASLLRLGDFSELMHVDLRVLSIPGTLIKVTLNVNLGAQRKVETDS